MLFRQPDYRAGGTTLLGLSLPVPSTTAGRVDISGKRFFEMIEIDGNFLAILLKAQSATGSKCASCPDGESFSSCHRASCQAAYYSEQLRWLHGLCQMNLKA